MFFCLISRVLLKVVPQMITSAVNPFPLMAIPVSMLAGAPMVTGRWDYEERLCICQLPGGAYNRGVGQQGTP